MYLAHGAEGMRIPAARDESGYCPSCNEQLTAKQGDIYVWHWSHKPGQACSYRRVATFWQYGWLSHYHATGEWEMEARLDSAEIDGIHWGSGIGPLRPIAVNPSLDGNTCVLVGSKKTSHFHSSSI